MRKPSNITKVFRFIITIFRFLIFYLMLWLRPIILRIGNLLSGFCFLIFVMGVIENLFLSLDFSWSFILSFGLTSFVIFWLTEYYDRILLRLNPTGNVLILGK